MWKGVLSLWKYDIFCRTILKLNQEESWQTFLERPEDAKQAWINANVTLVATIDGHIAGYLRGLTDTVMTLFICEVLVSSNDRGRGIGKALMEHAHSLYPKTRIDLLATGSSRDFHQKNDRFRPLYGFRKS